MRKILVTLGVGFLLLPQFVRAWGEKGHLMVNQLAIEAAAGDLPPFMATLYSSPRFNCSTA